MTKPKRDFMFIFFLIAGSLDSSGASGTSTPRIFSIYSHVLCNPSIFASRFLRSPSWQDTLRCIWSILRFAFSILSSGLPNNIWAKSLNSFLSVPGYTERSIRIFSTTSSIRRDCFMKLVLLSSWISFITAFLNLSFAVSRGANESKFLGIASYAGK